MYVCKALGKANQSSAESMKRSFELLATLVHTSMFSY